MDAEHLEDEEDEREDERNESDKVEVAATSERFLRLPHCSSDEADDTCYLQTR